MKHGRYNVAVGFFVMLAFMAYGFLLIYLRDFHPDREAWIAQYATGKHFEARLAHVHGNLFAVLNIAIGLVLARVEGYGRGKMTAAVLGLAGLLMPTGILLEVYLNAPPVFVLVGGVAMVAAVGVTGWLAWSGWSTAATN